MGFVFFFLFQSFMYMYCLKLDRHFILYFKWLSNSKCHDKEYKSGKLNDYTHINKTDTEFAELVLVTKLNDLLISNEKYRITSVYQLLRQDQTIVKSKQWYLTTCQFFHQLELEKIFILLINFSLFASGKIKWDEKQ